MQFTSNIRHIECTSHRMHVTFKAPVHNVWTHRAGHTNSSTRSWAHEIEYISWAHKVDILSWSMSKSANESMNDIHINIYRHINIHKRIRDVGCVVERTNVECLRCGVPDLSLLVHGRAFDLLVKTLHVFFSANRRKGGSWFCRLDRLVKWNSFDDRDSSRGDRRRYFWLMDLLLRSALPLPVNLNCYTTKVASLIKFLPHNLVTYPLSFLLTNPRN